MDGKQLISWGFEPGPWFQKALHAANNMEKAGHSQDEIYNYLLSIRPADKIGIRTNSIPFEVFTEPETDDEKQNVEHAVQHMDHIMRLPTIKSGVLMPDVCPAGSQLGTIPVGGVVATENAIHPSFHSADVCCSVAISLLNRNIEASKILDAAQKITHFGPGGRKDIQPSRYLEELIGKFKDNSFLGGLENYGLNHHMTQGDGNHFFFVGELNGDICIVTHHGSRGLGAEMYKRGKAVAVKETKKIAQGIPDHQAWIVADSDIGREYWEALHLVRQWTRENHFAIHRAITQHLGVRVKDRAWNEHNFVFQKPDGLFYHAKGSTPNYRGFAPDDSGVTLIPMTMGDGILISEHSSFEAKPESLEFCPHGAGRNMSRSSHYRSIAEAYGVNTLTNDLMMKVFEKETRHIDARFWNSTPDLSELPSAYKDAKKVISEIEKYKLANITSVIHPLGCIMAGNNQHDWKKYKKGK